MLLRYFYDDELAQASYLVGCAATGEALVIDPLRDVTPYLHAAEKAGLRITHVTETHIHADFVSGVRELAARTGATMYLSDMGDANWKYAYPKVGCAVLVRDGDSWMVGNIKIQVIETPGHTLEHIALMVTYTAATDQPLGVFTGDFLFVGDVGRPDLLEEAAGFVGTKEPGARMQFHTVERFKAMPDHLQIWPAHGAGSACGKARTRRSSSQTRIPSFAGCWMGSPRRPGTSPA
jgi:hydroxyacylglutathione hydrolase